MKSILTYVLLPAILIAITNSEELENRPNVRKPKQYEHNWFQPWKLNHQPIQPHTQQTIQGGHSLNSHVYHQRPNAKMRPAYANIQQNYNYDYLTPQDNPFAPYFLHHEDGVATPTKQHTNYQSYGQHFIPGPPRDVVESAVVHDNQNIFVGNINPEQGFFVNFPHEQSMDIIQNNFNYEWQPASFQDLAGVMTIPDVIENNIYSQGGIIFHPFNAPVHSVPKPVEEPVKSVLMSSDLSPENELSHETTDSGLQLSISFPTAKPLVLGSEPLPVHSTEPLLVISTETNTFPTGSSSAGPPVNSTAVTDTIVAIESVTTGLDFDFPVETDSLSVQSIASSIHFSSQALSLSESPAGIFPASPPNAGADFVSAQPSTPSSKPSSQPLSSSESPAGIFPDSPPNAGTDFVSALPLTTSSKPSSQVLSLSESPASIFPEFPPNAGTDFVSAQPPTPSSKPSSLVISSSGSTNLPDTLSIAEASVDSLVTPTTSPIPSSGEITSSTEAIVSVIEQSSDGTYDVHIDTNTSIVPIELRIKCLYKEKVQAALPGFFQNLDKRFTVALTSTNCGPTFASITGTLGIVVQVKYQTPTELSVKIKAECYFGCEIGNETYYFSDFMIDDTDVQKLNRLPENTPCGSRRNDVARVVNGESARNGQYPWMAALFVHYYDFKKSEYVFDYCGGSIISPRHILTAAHCLLTYPENGNVFVHVGDTELPFVNLTLAINEITNESRNVPNDGENVFEHVATENESNGALGPLQEILKILGNTDLNKQKETLLFLRDLLKSIVNTPENRRGKQVNLGRTKEVIMEETVKIRNMISEKFPELILAENAILHENFTYDDQRAENDIAILVLENPISFNDIVRPICVSPPNLKPENRVGVVTGWGKTADSDGETSLQVAGLPIWTLSECQSKYDIGNINPSKNTICAGGKKEAISACTGDSGGPLSYQLRDGRWAIVGVVSYTNIDTCDDLVPAVFTRVPNYVTWIRQSIGKQLFLSELSNKTPD